MSANEAADLVENIRQHVLRIHNLAVRTVLVQPRTLPKTTSGKVCYTPGTLSFPMHHTRRGVRCSRLLG